MAFGVNPLREAGARASQNIAKGGLNTNPRVNAINAILHYSPQLQFNPTGEDYSKKNKNHDLLAGLEAIYPDESGGLYTEA